MLTIKQHIRKGRVVRKHKRKKSFLPLHEGSPLKSKKRQHYSSQQAGSGGGTTAG